MRSQPLLDCILFGGTVGAVAEWSTTVLRVAGSIQHGTNIFVWPIGSCTGCGRLCTYVFFCLYTHDTGIIFLVWDKVLKRKKKLQGAEIFPSQDLGFERNLPKLRLLVSYLL